MNLRKTSSRVQSFPNHELEISTPQSNQFEQYSVFKLENLEQLQGCRISADHMSKILDASIVSQKMGLRMAMDALSSTAGSKLDWKLINCYVESAVLLLDACNCVHMRLESIRCSLDSIPIGLHYLEGEHEQNRTVLQRAAAALESSLFRDKEHCSKMQKNMARMKSFGKKLTGYTKAYPNTVNGFSPNLFKALSSSWENAVLALGVLNSATSFWSLSSPCIQPPKVETWTMILSEHRSRMKVLPNKPYETAPMVELAAADLAVQTLLKLVSSCQKGDNSSLRRMALKAVAGVLKRRKEELEKTLPLLEEKIEELYRHIVTFRISMLGLHSMAQKEDVWELVKLSGCEESRMGANPVYISSPSLVHTIPPISHSSC